MKCIGMLGGMSWESTLSYYQGLNEGIKHRLGGLHSARISLHSVDFAKIEELQHKGDWDKTAEILIDAAQGVEKSGADFLMICTNTMHKVAPEIQEGLTIPLLHIADATGQRLKEDNIQRVGLLGTKFTMEQDFYKGYLTQHHGIEVMVPDEAPRQWVHQIIYDELCRGEIKEDSRDLYLEIIKDLHEEGCEAVILGCTEIALLVQQDQTDVPLYDTTQIHVEKAIDWALDNG